jgi:NAD(P)-dependent dehydrogenase (short-subunit alcohol dehydrogenase family)
VGGFTGGRAGVAYTASKHGAIGLTRNIAAYSKAGIRCNTICPEDLATLATFLASDDASPEWFGGASRRRLDGGLSD